MQILIHKWQITRFETTVAGSGLKPAFDSVAAAISLIVSLQRKRGKSLLRLAYRARTKEGNMKGVSDSGNKITQICI